MTENQEKELFTTLANLVSGVSQIQFHIKDVKSEVTEIKSDITDIKSTLEQHSNKLDHLVAKTDTIADQVIQNDIRLSARLASVEHQVAELGGKAQ